MKISVASDGMRVSEHFGHCEGFLIFTVEDSKLVKKEFMQNPGHKPGLLPNLLHQADVDVVISGGMGGGAIEIFNEHNIQVITGASGDAEEAVIAYVQGKLASTGSVCHEHQHSDECGH